MHGGNGLEIPIPQAGSYSNIGMPLWIRKLPKTLLDDLDSANQGYHFTKGLGARSSISTKYNSLDAIYHLKALVKWHPDI